MFFGQPPERNQLKGFGSNAPAGKTEGLDDKALEGAETKAPPRPVRAPGPPINKFSTSLRPAIGKAIDHGAVAANVAEMHAALMAGKLGVVSFNRLNRAQKENALRRLIAGSEAQQENLLSLMIEAGPSTSPGLAGLTERQLLKVFERVAVSLQTRGPHHERLGATLHAAFEIMEASKRSKILRTALVDSSPDIRRIVNEYLASRPAHAAELLRSAVAHIATPLDARLRAIFNSMEDGARTAACKALKPQERAALEERLGDG